MTAPNPSSASRLLWRYLWGWTLLALLAIWFTLAGVSYYTGVHEAEEITDGQLMSTAELLLRQTGMNALDLTGPGAPAGAPARETSGYAPELRVVAWENDRLAWDTHGMAGRLPPSLVAGHHTLVLSLDGQVRTWRVFVADSASPGQWPRRVAVMMDTQRHAALGRDIAEHIVRPALVLLPLVAWLLAWAIRRGLRPLHHLSGAIDGLDIDGGQTLPDRQPYHELAGIVRAINTLVNRLQAQWQRERSFASDVAHELRTPLAAMVLQAGVAREATAPEVREAACRQVEHDALRAGRILSQLLELARAQGQGHGEQDRVDLCDVAHRVTLDHVALAHELGQDIGVEVPPEPVTVLGKTAMVELALRNLVDNALRHTPPGTQVMVRVSRADGKGVEVSVCDDGGRPGHAANPRPGLGIGLTLVQRIADASGVRLRQGAGAAPFTTCYALVWPTDTDRR